MQLGGKSIRDLRDQFHRELFEVVLPFWDCHGIDHEYGGFMCSLDHDGRLVNSNKFHWFQGRGVWLYSFLYGHLGGDPHHLAIARKAKDFMLRHFPHQDGWWAPLLSREGRQLEPFRGDLYGMYFAIEGLVEYAAAARDEQALEIALEMFDRLWHRISRPDFGARSQGLWMVNLLIATRLLQSSNPPRVAEIAEFSVDAIINRHYNPEIGLNNEVLNFDFSRPKEEQFQCVFGHSIECLWMVMDEAERTGNPQLASLAAERIRRHLDVGWDHVFGGLAAAVNVDQVCYEWPIERPVQTGLEFHERGEYNYMKSFWAANETQVAALKVFERFGAEWAGRYFTLAQEAAREKFSLKSRGYPLYLLFSDRRISFQPRTFRQDNYHLPRQLALNILALDRLLMKPEPPAPGRA